MRPLRVAHLISSRGFYGAEQVVLTLARSAPRLETTTAILCFEDARRPNRELSERAATAGVETRRVPCRKRLDRSTFVRLLAELKDLDTGVLHTHGAKADLYGLLAGRWLGLPVLATVHLWSQTPLSVKVYDWVDALLLRFFDRVVAVSEEIAEEMLKKKIPRRLIRIVSNGVDVAGLSAFQNGTRREARRELEIPEHAPVVGIVGRLSPEKGHRFFLEAGREVLRSRPEAVFVIVGGGLLESDLKARAAALGIRDAVRFAGVRRDIGRFYDAFDLVVSSSLREGTPMALLEAMAMAKPVVATAVGGVPTLVRHDQTGVLVPPGSAPALAAAIVELLSDRARRERLASAGQCLVVEECSAERMATEYARVYQEARALR